MFLIAYFCWFVSIYWYIEPNDPLLISFNILYVSETYDKLRTVNSKQKILNLTRICRTRKPSVCEITKIYLFIDF